MTQRKQNSTSDANEPQHTNEIVSGEKKSDERSKLASPTKNHMRSTFRRYRQAGLELFLID
jgi:hypothetical protein